MSSIAIATKREKADAAAAPATPSLKPKIIIEFPMTFSMLVHREANIDIFELPIALNRAAQQL